jgi:hypothetical protein
MIAMPHFARASLISSLEFLGVALGVVGLFVCLWCAVSFFISRAGWYRFAEAYGHEERPPGRRYKVSIGIFGTSSYKNTIHVVPCPEGLYCYVGLLFSPGHRPFLLPWSSIQKVEQTQFWVFRSIKVEIKDAAGLASLRLADTFKVEALKYVTNRFVTLPI